jgi:ASC-1-like (ASCH) protein
VKVIAIRHYDNLLDYLLAEGIGRTLPGINNMQDALSEYHVHYSDESISTEGGINALEITR